MTSFCRAIIAATAPFAAAFKINFAFFEALGSPGWEALETVRRTIPAAIPAIADAKRGDIGNTARAYAEAIFSRLDFDAVTVSPYLGWDSLEPFLSREGKGVFVLCKTSNPGSGDLQDLRVNGGPLYMIVAREALEERGPADVGLVVGASYPGALSAARSLSERLLFLVPGVGAQGGEIRKAVACGANRAGENALIAVSRHILYASPRDDYPEAAAGEAERLARQTRLANDGTG